MKLALTLGGGGCLGGRVSRLSIEDRSIFQLLVECPMNGLMITVPEYEECPFHGGLFRERRHFPDDSYVTGYVQCRYGNIGDEARRESNSRDTA